MKHASLKSAILIPVTIILVLVILAEVILLGVLSANTSNKLAGDIVTNTVSRYATEFDKTGDSPYNVVLAIAPVIQQLSYTENGREEAVKILVSVLENNDDFESIWTCWEPNTFDGRDSLYRNSDNHDSSGRFIPNAYRTASGSVEVDPLIEYETAAFYQETKRTGKANVTDPYIYNQGGRDVLMYSITVPVYKNGSFVGAVGIEVDIERVMSLMNQGKVMGDGEIFTLSPGGIITTHPDESQIMLHYSDTWLQQYTDELEQLSHQPGSFSQVTYSDVLERKILFAAESIQIADTDKYWIVCSVTPQKTVMRSSYFLVGALIVVSLVLIVVVALTIRLIVQKRLSKLPKMLEMADSLANGEVNNITVDTGERDEATKNEIYLLEQAFQRIALATKEQVDILQRIAAGDLSVQVMPRSGTDLLNTALAELVESNNQMLQQIVGSAQQVETGSRQMADASQLLAQASMEQTTSISRLTESLNQIAKEAETNEEIAEQAARISSGIVQFAQKGSEHMQQMTGAVNDINDASKDIGRVIKVINDIAYQTNILALNAAVEAARAGQYGKGFAVVADEVRSLAAKSAEAANDTRNLIQNSIEKAELGARIAAETADILNQIVSGIDENSQAVCEIVPLARHQGSGIKNIHVGIDQIMQAAQQNSAISEESAASSEEMQGQAQLLLELVAQFKLRQGGRPPLQVEKHNTMQQDAFML